MTPTPSTPSPSPRSFLVRFAADLVVPFLQVEVANCDLPALEYRHGNSPVFYPIKMPGLGRVGNVILSDGRLAAADQLAELQQRAAAGEGAPGVIAIDLLDESGAKAATWTLNNAWPTKVTPGGASPEGGGTVAALEVSFERLAIVVPPEV